MLHFIKIVLLVLLAECAGVGLITLIYMLLNKIKKN